MIFIDTTIWVSGIDSSDKLHRDGRAVMEALSERTLPPALTTDFVLDETLTILKRRGARSAAVVDATDQILSSPLVGVVYVDEQLFKEAMLNFRKYERLSFTDAVTLTVMHRHKIREVFSHDKDFDLKGMIRKERP